MPPLSFCGDMAQLAVNIVHESTAEPDGGVSLHPVQTRQKGKPKCRYFATKKGKEFQDYVGTLSLPKRGLC